MRSEDVNKMLTEFKGSGMYGPSSNSPIITVTSSKDLLMTEVLS